MKTRMKKTRMKMKKTEEEMRLDASEVKQSLEAWEKLKSKAEEILAAEGNTIDDGIVGIELDCSGKLVDISYWTRCKGESYVEDDLVPVEWFSASREELKELWQKKRESDMRAMERAARAAERRQKQLKAKQKELKKKRELATLKRLKAKYPGV